MVKCVPALWVVMVYVVVCGAEWTSATTSALNNSINTLTTTSPLLSALLDGVDSMLNFQNQGSRRKYEKEQRSTELSECKLVNTSDIQPGLQGIVKLRKFATTFFVRTRTSFKKIVFKIKLSHMLEPSNTFYTNDKLNLFSFDLGASNEWKQITVEYYDHTVRGPDKHALRVLVGSTNLSLTSDYRWIFYDYEGFAIYAEGGAEFLFNCQPDLLQGRQRAGSRSAGVWLMVGLLVMATLFLVTLIIVWLSLKYKKERELRESVPQYPIYDEFDEEVLRRLRQKVEALREGKDDLCVVTDGASRTENQYVIVDTKQKQAETSNVCYENPYSLEETQRNQAEMNDIYYENLYSRQGTQQEQAETDDNIYECPYALIHARQKELNKDYENIYSIRPYISTRR